ncbi:MAG TPA: hypothetical protein VKY92_17115 [Verrucomicrobiae bacterium]|nr:hypothetical protein [Verrucomicrobiae bacterium]
MNARSLANPFSHRPTLSRTRIVLAMTVAVVTDAVQVGLGPFGWAFVDEGLDVLAMVLISAIIGFHTLLLPTFIIEFIPGPDMLPTWTGCTAAVIFLRKRKAPAPPPVIDVETEVTTSPPAPPKAHSN